MLLRYTANLGGAGVQGGSPIRILVVYDRQANAVTPIITNILQTDDFNSPQNLDYASRFFIMMDIITEPLSTTGNEGIGAKRYKRLNTITEFNTGNAGTVGDITTGAVYLMIAQNSSISGGGIGTFAFYNRLRFSDV